MTRERTILRSARRIARRTVPPPRAPIATYFTSPAGVRTPRGPVSIPGVGPFADAAVAVSATASAAVTRIAVRIVPPFAPVSAGARETSRPRHGERARVDAAEARAASTPHEHEPPSLQPQLHAEPASDLPRQIDATRSAVSRVERVNERLLVVAAVERVRPAAVARGRTRDWEAVHLLVGLAPVDDRAADEPAGRDVVGAHAVLREVTVRQVLGQVERRPVGRERVVRVRTAQDDRANGAEALRRDHREPTDAGGRPAAGKGRQHEGRAVGRDASGRSVEGDEWDAVPATQPRRANDAAAVHLHDGEGRGRATDQRDVADAAGGSEDAVPAGDDAG